MQIQNCTRKNSYAIDQLSDQKRKFELNMSLINYFKFSKMSSVRCVKDMIMISQFYFQLKQDRINSSEKAALGLNRTKQD